MARAEALARLAGRQTVGDVDRLPRPPALSGREVDAHGRARRVAIRNVNLSYPVERTAVGARKRTVQQLMAINAGDVVLVTADVAEAYGRALVTEDAYQGLLDAYAAQNEPEGPTDADGPQGGDEAVDGTAPADGEESAADREAAEHVEADPDGDGTVDASRTQGGGTEDEQPARRVRRASASEN